VKNWFRIVQTKEDAVVGDVNAVGSEICPEEANDMAIALPNAVAVSLPEGLSFRTRKKRIARTISRTGLYRRNHFTLKCW
jgi:hypothetical protein